MILTSNYSIILVFITFICKYVSTYQIQRKSKPTPTPYHDWDYLMFSQRWPITSCAEWQAAKPDNTCSMPSDKDQWNIHGIWPTKIGTEGPLFCPSAIHFDPDQLDPLLDDLKEHWTNIEGNTKAYSFWKHEWDKHGTCSATLPLLNSIPNFFMRGLEWNKMYNLTNMLAQSKIVPGTDGYTVEQVTDAIKSVTKFEPMVQCVVDPHTKLSMISEIRICFDKSFQLIDCDPTNPVNNKLKSVITNCSEKKPLMYLATVPNNLVSYQMDYVDEYLEEEMKKTSFYMEFYELLKFLIWITI